MSRLQELLKLKKIETVEQKEEVNFFIAQLDETNLTAMREQFVLEEKVNTLKEKIENELPNPFRNPDVVNIHKKIMKIDYKNQSRFQKSQKLKGLLEKELIMN